MHELGSDDLRIKTLGPATIASPLELSSVLGDHIPDYVPDGLQVALDVEFRAEEAASAGPRLGFEKAGPREKIFFEPARTRAAIVTCGGLCPGINNVIRSMTLELHHKYRVKDVIGFRYGYRGIAGTAATPPVTLTPEAVRSIHRLGGTMLGSSRGEAPVGGMVDALVGLGVDVLFTVGGDGTLRGAHALAEEIARRGLPIAIVGVPKTIDNDLEYMDKSFGFDTAVEAARVAVDAAHAEAIGALNGIGLVKLMGRDSGFIAAAATLASRDVNFCLIPEVGFDLDGPRGLLAAIERRLAARGHAVIVAAEGCGALLPNGGAERDESGNARYGGGAGDVGPRLRDAIRAHLEARGVPFTLKYIDPSYLIRGVPANAGDSIFCDMLARHAVHAGMSGRTDLVVGRWHQVFMHVPIPLATRRRNRVDPDGQLWLAVTEATGQRLLFDSSVPGR